MTALKTNSPSGMPRWYMPTPGKFVAILLLSVVSLYLSDQYDWFAFNKQKGWTVLIALVFVIAGLGLMVALSAGAWLLGRRGQFGLLVLLLMVPTIAVPLGWLTREMQQAKQLSDAIAQVERGGGSVFFDLNRNRIPRSIPLWLLRVFGTEFFGEVDTVYLAAENHFSDVTPFHHTRVLIILNEDNVVEDDDLDLLVGFPQFESLTVFRTTITDAGLEKLQRISTLKRVMIFESKITSSGRENFKQAVASRCEVDISLARVGLIRSARYSWDGTREANARRAEDPYSLEYIGPPSTFSPLLDDPDENLSDDSPAPPPPIGKGIWPHAKSSDPLQD